MKIGINASFLRKPSTGIGQVTTHFLNNLIYQIKENKKYKNYKFVLYLEEDIDLDLPKNFEKKVFLPFHKRDDLFRKLIWEKFSLPCRVKKDGCDVLFSLYQSATIIKYLGIKHIVLVHDIIPQIFPEYLNNFRKKFYQAQVEKGIYGSHLIFSVSDYTKKDLVEKMNIKPNKIIVNHIDIDPIYSTEISQNEIDRVLKKYKLDELNKGFIYTGGGLEIRKNTDGVLRAYKKLVEKNANIPPLVISGKLMPELVPLVVDVEKMVKELKLEEKVKILDYVEQKDLPVLYKKSLMFVRPSHYEGFGMPELEALRVGTPAIVSASSSIPEVCESAVLYVDDYSDDDIAEKMSSLLYNEKLREELVEKGKKQAEKFSWDKFAENFFSVIENFEKNK